MITYFQCNLKDKVALAAGPLPTTWGALSSLPQSGHELACLAWAGYPETGFLAYDEARNIGISVETLDAAKAPVIESQWEEIQALRDAKRAGGVKVGDKWFHADDSSRIQHLANKDSARDALAAGGHPSDALSDPATGEPLQWKTMDGSMVAMTVQLALDVVAGMKAHDSATFAAALAHRAAMTAATDPLAYVFTLNWPAVYGESA